MCTQTLLYKKKQIKWSITWTLHLIMVAIVVIETRTHTWWMENNICFILLLLVMEVVGYLRYQQNIQASLLLPPITLLSHLTPTIHRIIIHQWMEWSPHHAQTQRSFLQVNCLQNVLPQHVSEMFLFFYKSAHNLCVTNCMKNKKEKNEYKCWYPFVFVCTQFIVLC